MKVGSCTTSLTEYYLNGKVKFSETKTITSKPLKETILSEEKNPSSQPGYYRKKNSGTLVANPYSARTWFQSPEPGWSGHVIQRSFWSDGSPATVLDISYNNWPVTQPCREGVAFPVSTKNAFPPAHSSPPLTNLDNSSDLLQLFARAVEKGRRDVYDLLTEIFESKETVQMVKVLSRMDALKEKVTLYNNQRRDFIKAAQPAWKKAVRTGAKPVLTGKASALAASAWLTYRYGIMPIVYSLNDLKDLFNLARVTDSHTTERDTLLKETIQPFQSYTLLNSDVFDGRGWYRGRIDTDTLMKRFKLVGFNPIRSTWEVTRLSFVVDWLIPIGQNINLFLANQPTTNEIGGYSQKRTRSTKKVFKAFESNQSFGKDSYITLLKIQSPWEVTETTYSRSPHPLGPGDVPPIMPNLNYSISRFFDTVALLRVITGDAADSGIEHLMKGVRRQGKKIRPIL